MQMYKCMYGNFRWIPINGTLFGLVISRPLVVTGKKQLLLGLISALTPSVELRFGITTLDLNVMFGLQVPLMFGSAIDRNDVVFPHSFLG